MCREAGVLSSSICVFTGLSGHLCFEKGQGWQPGCSFELVTEIWWSPKSILHKSLQLANSWAPSAPGWLFKTDVKWSNSASSFSWVHNKINSILQKNRKILCFNIKIWSGVVDTPEKKTILGKTYPKARCNAVLSQEEALVEVTAVLPQWSGWQCSGRQGWLSLGKNLNIYQIKMSILAHPLILPVVGCE